MADVQPEDAGRRGRRSRVSNDESRLAALRRLRSARTGGDRRRAEVKMEAPIYDTVEEDDYKSLVAKRKEDFKDFIVDDNGLGYGDEGEEEDWSQAGGPMSSDESGGESEKPKKKKVAEKKDPAPKKPNSFAAAAALMGKQNLSSMYASSVFKKNRDNKGSNLSSGSLVDDLIAEHAPDEADRERRRRARLNLDPALRSQYLPIAMPPPPPPPVELTKHINIDPNPSISSKHFVNNEERSEMGNESNLPMETEIGIDLKSEVGIDSSEVISEPPLTNGSMAAAAADDDAKIQANAIELKPEITPVIKQEGGFVLNATVNNDIKDPAASATAGWQAVMNAGKGSNVCDEAETVPSMNSNEKLNLDLQSDGSLPFYILDAYEEYYGANMGNLYLFGKVKTESTYSSCCVVVTNMQRCVYAIPHSSVFPEDAIMKLENDLKEQRISRSSFMIELQAMASGLKTEITKELLDRNVSSFSLKPVKRSYAFEQSEQSDIPLGQYTVLKVNYPFKDPPLPSDLKGDCFSALLGTHSSALEHFLVKRKIKGPSWLSVLNFSTRPAAQLVSWCKYEVIVECPKDVKVSTFSDKPPPVVATAINLKTILSEKHNGSEIVSASIICCQKAKIDQPTLDSEWTKPGVFRHFTVTRKLEGGIFPMGFSREVEKRNSETGANVISIEGSERALINRLMIELHKWDSDILVGHNISGFDLDVLLHRAQACKVSSNMWSKIGRLKRSVMPKLSKGNTIFGSGASPGIMSCIAGRLLCDTYLSSRDLLKEVSYSLTQLAKSQLKKDRKEIAPHNIHSMFQKSESLMELIKCSETDAWLSMELMFRLNVLPLTRQLTILSGNLWGKTLQGARAQRVEYLLLHAFHAKKYMVPDKLSPRSKEIKVTKRKVNQGVADGDNNDANIDNPENDLPDRENSKAKKGPSYAGGLVLEPKKGLYDKYILLLDFNSLYPSIIQEYNICFTTVEKSAEGVYHLPSNGKTPGVLPQLLKYLVERRKTVKSLLLRAKSNLEADQLQIQQQALKLTANSMYGCLGFSNSRFYAKPLAEMITLQGREILQNTVDLVQNKLNLEVIYGDTDSIMIYSGLDDAEQAAKISTSVIKEVNRKYKCLEIDLDGLYKRMLLLKKKKYAAVKVAKKDGISYEVIERKGLDMVRRDWSLLSKEIGDFCLDQILSGGSCENVVESIHNALMKAQEDMRNGQVELDKYVITKSLTKPPEAYPDGKNQPHVEVALRMKKNGHTSGCSTGDTVPYIICCEKGAGSSSSVGIAQRARHPDELKRENDKWMIDIDYYLSQQIHPVVSRLCASIEGTSPARLADCLGLDSSKFQSKSSEGAADASSSLLFAVNDDERYQDCEPLVLSCQSCLGSFECPTVLSSILASISEEQTNQLAGEPSKTFWSKLRCPKCPNEGDTGKISPRLIVNQVKTQAEGFISRYYKGLMTCDEETCNYNTVGVNLRVVGDSERGTICPNYPRCTGHLTRKYTEADLYKQLSYFCNVLDTARCIEKVENDMKIPVGKELARIRPMVDLAASTVQKMRDRCAFGWVQLKDLVVLV